MRLSEPNRSNRKNMKKCCISPMIGFPLEGVFWIFCDLRTGHFSRTSWWQFNMEDVYFWLTRRTNSQKITNLTIIKWDPFWRDQSHKQMLLVIFRSSPKNSGWRLGWCHITMTPDNTENSPLAIAFLDVDGGALLMSIGAAPRTTSTRATGQGTRCCGVP